MFSLLVTHRTENVNKSKNLLKLQYLSLYSTFVSNCYVQTRILTLNNNAQMLLSPSSGIRNKHSQGT